MTNDEAWGLGLYAMKWYHVWRFYLVGCDYQASGYLTWELHYMNPAAYKEFIEGANK